jgi:hypothetical protein
MTEVQQIIDKKVENKIAKHFNQLIIQFIKKEKQTRFRQSYNHIDHYEKSLREEYCHLLGSQLKFPQVAGDFLGGDYGFYFSSDRKEACLLTVREALSMHFKDCLLSLSPGKLALYMTHHDNIYLCTTDEKYKTWCES